MKREQLKFKISVVFNSELLFREVLSIRIDLAKVAWNSMS